MASSTAQRAANVFRLINDVTEDDSALMEKMKCFASVFALVNGNKLYLENLRLKRSLLVSQEMNRFL